MEFSQKSYSSFLDECSKKFVFCDYSNFQDKQNFLLLRHDIDFSVENALQMAKIESNLGVQSTYLFDIHSPFYNPLEESEIEKIHAIKSMGHKIGIHFDHTPYKLHGEDELLKHLKMQIDIFNHYFCVIPEVFSFHNPDTVTAKFDKYKYCNTINTYATLFKSSVPYCSDSGGVWRFKNLMDFIHDTNIHCAQILVHPIWWQQEVAEPLTKVRRTLNLRVADNLAYYVRRLRESGRIVDAKVIQMLLEHSSLDDLTKRLHSEGGME